MSTPSDQGKHRLRNIIAVTCIASVSFAIVQNISNGRADVGADPVTAAMDVSTGAYTYGKFHQSGLGGIFNMAHPAGARARRRLSQANVIVPKSVTPGAVPSLARQNIENLHGHYVHDEHRSPFASFLYDRPKEELEAEQEEYVDKMNGIREKWGAWDFKDDEEIRPLADFSKTNYKDLSNSDFPEKSWQMDKKYVTDLIAEGRKLVDRVREGIYAEYGWATEDLTKEKIDERNELFAVHITEVNEAHPTKGLTWINQKGFDMLVRKLLHSMITNDEFYFILGGHSAAAGHGNMFHQQYTMQFANIMETVFHKLGMRLIARNLAMGGLGTTHFSFGQSTLYGEKDFLIWDSDMTEGRSIADQELYNKQALLGGERVPILSGAATTDLETALGDNFWYGADLLRNFDFVPLTTGLDQVEELPFAARYVSCEPSVAMCGGRGMDKYHSTCWVPRSDFNITSKQLNWPGGRASWHPGDREHQIRSRKHIMLFLKAFDKAFQVWEKGIEVDGFPLKETYWHVGGHYTAARTALTSYINREDIINTTVCETRFAPYGLEKACRVKMSGMTEWTPRNSGNENNIVRHVKAAPNGYKPETQDPIYEGPNILPQFLKLPKGEIDLHAIALVTTYSPAELDQSFVDDDDEDAEEAENSRRMLREAIGMEKTPSLEDAMDEVNPEISRERQTESDDKVVPGLGWGLNDEYAGFCDGSPMSTCNRGPKSNCYQSGHNDGRSHIAGNALSSWIVITIPKVEEGLIFAKLQWWFPRGESFELTKGWTEVNNGVTFDGDDRQLKSPPIPWPDDITLDISLNGEIYRTFVADELNVMKVEAAYNEAYYKFVDDPDRFDGGPVELGMRIQSTEKPKDASFGITHIYWA